MHICLSTSGVYIYLFYVKKAQTKKKEGHVELMRAYIENTKVYR